jgi:hypothetical protein
MPAQGQITSDYIKLLKDIRQSGGVPCELLPDVFFPEDIPDPAKKKAAISKAKELCRSCPIIEKCFEYALKTNQRHGIWGATEAHER